MHWFMIVRVGGFEFGDRNSNRSAGARQTNQQNTEKQHKIYSFSSTNKSKDIFYFFFSLLGLAMKGGSVEEEVIL